MNKQEVIERLNNKLGETFAFQRNFEPLTWSHMECESKANAYMTAINYVEQLDEPQKVKVPAFVAPFIDKLKTTNRRYGFELERTYESSEDNDLRNWIGFNENVLTVFKALENGYEVEEEQLYQVIINGDYLIKLFDNRNDHKFVGKEDLVIWLPSGYQLTEAEIKAIDERYWPFAVPVEKVEV